MANAEPLWRMRLPCLKNAFGDVVRGTGHVGRQVGGDRLSALSGRAAEMLAKYKKRLLACRAAFELVFPV